MKHRYSSLALVITMGCAALIVAAAMANYIDMSPLAIEPAGGLADLQTASSAASAQSRPKPFAVSVRKPQGAPRLKLASPDPQGGQGEVACSTCHSVRLPNVQNTAAELDEFHQGLAFAHGTLACYACHHSEDADVLRLADGTSIEYPEVMTLCSQCHGPLATAFAHGAHGGMNGYWDLSRGPQSKNNCIDCHDPHSPAYPKMVVGFKPKDRFNYPLGDNHQE